VASEIAILGRCLTLAARAHYIAVRPPLPRVGGPDRARQGFFEPAQAEAVFAQLPEPIAQMMRFCLLTGWRTGAARTLEWRDVNFDLGVVRLDPRHSKNKMPVVFPFIPPLAAVLHAAREATSAVERATGTICPLVFHRNGRPIKDYRGAWEIACRRAGVPGKIPHDFRRTAARNMIRSGVPERIAMQLLGHRTRAIFDRYCIVSEADLNTAASRLATQHAADTATAAAGNTGTTPLPSADLGPAHRTHGGAGGGA
jgi:integrase